MGYEISVTNMGAALVANVRPKPIMKLEGSAGEKQEARIEPKVAYRAAMNMPILVAADCIATAAIMMVAPMKMAGLRPIPSERYGAKG